MAVDDASMRRRGGPEPSAQRSGGGWAAVGPRRAAGDGGVWPLNLLDYVDEVILFSHFVDFTVRMLVLNARPLHGKVYSLYVYWLEISQLISEERAVSQWLRLLLHTTSSPLWTFFRAVEVCLSALKTQASHF